MTTSVNSAFATVSDVLSQMFSWRGRRAHLVACTIVVVVAAAYLAPLMLKGWVPFDEGTLGQSAHRILIGQLPHRDFDEVYTGGLSFAHAAAFRIMGENLVTLRSVLFIAILLVLPACYYIASRFASPIAAAGLSIAILLASFPSYPAAMPSWYNLIFALFGCAAFLRYLEAGTKRWIFAAGLCGGLSVVVKIVGVYFIAAGALFLIFHAFASPSSDAETATRSRAGTALVLVILGVLATAPFAVMHGRLRLAEAVELGLPVIAVCVAVALEVWRSAKRVSSTRALAKLVALGWPFAIGVLVPVVCLIARYARAEALPSFYRGVFVLPQRRLDWTAEDGPPVIALLLGLPPLYLLVSARFSMRALQWYDTLLLGALEIGLVTWSAFSLKVTAALWNSIRMAASLMVAAGAVVLVSSHGDGGTSPLRRQQLLVLVSSAAWCALIQFPTDTYQYFLYALPLFVLSGAALAAIRGNLSRIVALTTLAAFVVLGFLLRPVFVAGGGSHVVLAGQPTAKLDVGRGGLTVRRAERDEYVHVVALIEQHSRSPFIYVSPDAPEVYFLANRENPTRTLFDFFDDPRDRTHRVLAAIRDHTVDVVVINRQPRFSGEMPADLHDSLSIYFGETADVGQFEVRWRP